MSDETDELNRREVVKHVQRVQEGADERAPFMAVLLMHMRETEAEMAEILRRLNDLRRSHVEMTEMMVTSYGPEVVRAFNDGEFHSLMRMNSSKRSESGQLLDKIRNHLGLAHPDQVVSALIDAATYCTGEKASSRIRRLGKILMASVSKSGEGSVERDERV